MNPTPDPMKSPARCAPLHDEAVQHYLDGVLPFEAQPALFSHLSTCPSCREQMNAVLTFRRLSRQEYLAVPPVADDQFFERLARQKAQSSRFDRAADRRPLWQARAAISLRAAVLTGLVLLMLGVLAPSRSMTQAMVYAEVEEELVEFPEITFPIREPLTVYIFYPGLTIEAPKYDAAVQPATLLPGAL